jgi:kinesin family protein 4/21/27
MSIQTPNSSSVKVGVRIRPLLSKERSQSASQTLSVIDGNALNFKGQQFTYDHVFGDKLMQCDLYVKTAAPMLKSFMEGYNVTIMAYGQTGSGKTYTMGTSTEESDDYKGLVPRFIADLFDNLSSPDSGATAEQHLQQHHESESVVTISFLEIYGEDVYDLLGVERYTNTIINARVSMSVREDEKGVVFVQGLNSKQVTSAAKALELLNEGTRNRITASTNMNAGSSRSHAVFTVTLDQVVRSHDNPDDVHQMQSKLTFVDLAGSERIKRTGAEGQRMKEGIQINSGLFNLGQVINALADDQRIKQGIKASHVPYRNSKLTHLLKDALGGNSQTLFLACVSPAESNESETYSTLCYARQARNIQNKPVINMDKTQFEIRRLKFAVKTWMLKACGQKFNDAGESARASLGEHLQVLMSPTASFSPSKEIEYTSFLSRPEVQEYVEAVNRAINEKINGENPTPRKIRLSMGLGLSPLRRSMPHGGDMARKLHYNAYDERPVGSSADAAGAGLGCEDHENRRGSVLHSVEVLEQQQDPEETEALVQRMLEMVNKEKEQYAHETRELEKEEEDEQILQVENEISEKENILTKLMGTVKGYSTMKADFEKLLDEIGTLEVERQNLERELEHAKKAESKHPAAGEKAAGTNPAAVERIKDRYMKVKKELEEMRVERTKKENAYRLMQKESKQCTTLEREIKKLKESRNSMVKAQKAAIVQFQKKEKEHLHRIGGMKKSDVKRQQQVNTLKSEIVKKDRVLGHKDREIGRINSKLRACEEHIAQLLRIQNRNRTRLTNAAAKIGPDGTPSSNGLTNTEQEHLHSSKAMLDNLVSDRVEKRLVKAQYEHKSAALQELNREMVAEACEMKVLLAQRKTTDETKDAGSHIISAEEEELSHQIDICESNIDRITRELDIYNADLDDLSERMDPSLFAPARRGTRKKADQDAKDAWEVLGKEIIQGFSVAQFRVLLWDVVGEKADALEEQKLVKEENKELKDTNETLSEKIAETERILQQVRQDSKRKLEAAERQRVQDVWDVVNASETGCNESNAAAKVAIQRAQDLEREVEGLLSREEAHKVENDALTGTIRSLTKQADEMQLRMDMASVDFDGSAATDKTSVKRSSASSAKAIANAAKFEQLEELWSRIGVPADEKRKMILDLQNASCVMHDKLLTDMSEDLDACTKEIEELDTDLGVAHICLGREADSEALRKEDYSHVRARLGALHKACETVNDEFNERSAKLVKIKEHLLDLMNEMWLDTNDLAADLQPLIKVMVADSSTFELASRLHSLGLRIVDSSFEAWERELRKLNVARAQTTNSLIFVRDKALNLGEALGILDEAQLRAVVQSAPFMEDLTEQAINGAIELLVGHSASNPPGSAQLLKSSEMLLLLLESVDSSRKHISKHVVNFLSAYREGAHLDNYVAPQAVNDTFSRETLTNLLEAGFGVALEAEHAVPDLKTQLSTVLGEIDIGQVDGCVVDTRLQRIDAMLLQTRSTPVNNQSLSTMRDCIDLHLRKLAHNAEEGWLRLFLEKWFADFVCSDEEVDGYECVRQAVVLAEELHRLLRIRDAHRQLMQLDNTLTSHVKEMEDFEETSKQDRTKILKGNSTALLAEEKYRRNGKKKYEVITDKILAAGEALQILLAVGGSGSGSNSPNTPSSAARTDSGHLAISIDLSALSTRGQDFLSGKKVFSRDFSELMHLHTTNMGSRRISGQNPDAHTDVDKENSPAPESNTLASSSSSNALPNPMLLPPQAPDDMPDFKATAAAPKGSRKAPSVKTSALPKPAPSRTTGRHFKSAECVSGN